MARYRKVETAVWGDERFRAMSAAKPNGQTLWLYLLCGPRTTTFPGLVVAREAVMADDLGWSVEGFRQAFGEALREGLVEADWKAGVVVLKKALLDGAGDPRETSRPESPNVLRSWSKSWDEVPDCALKADYLRHLGSFAQALGETFAQAFREAFRKALAKASPHPSPNQDQEQKQEQEQDKTPLTPLKGGTPKRSRKQTHSDEQVDAAKRTLAHIAKRTGVQYQAAAPHVNLIVARLSEPGVTEHDLRCVVAYCWDPTGLDWKNATTSDGVPMAKHLVPETLFGPKKLHKYLEPARAWYRENIAPRARDATPEQTNQPVVLVASQIRSAQ